MRSLHRQVARFSIDELAVLADPRPNLEVIHVVGELEVNRDTKQVSHLAFPTAEIANGVGQPFAGLVSGQKISEVRIAFRLVRPPWRASRRSELRGCGPWSQPTPLRARASRGRARHPCVGMALVSIATNLTAMSNVATRKDVRDAVRVLTVRFGVAAVLIIAAAAALLAR